MIRDAVEHDLPVICSLIVEFYKSVMDKDTYAEEYRDIVEGLMESGIVLVSEQDGNITGFMIGRLIDSPMFKTMMLQEVAWFDKAGNGGRLARAFVQAAKELEVDAIYMTVLESAGQRTHDFVQRVMKGVPIERSYLIKM